MFSFSAQNPSNIENKNAHRVALGEIHRSNYIKNKNLLRKMKNELEVDFIKTKYFNNLEQS